MDSDVIDEGHDRFAAIVFFDTVPQTCGPESELALAAWNSACTDVILPMLLRHPARKVMNHPEGFIAAFDSVLEAVEFAIAVQARLFDNLLNYRVGIHFGELIEEGDGLRGKALAIAARIQEQAEPGDVYVSKVVWEQVTGRVGHEFKDLGERTLKHIPEPMRLFRVEGIRKATVAA